MRGREREGEKGCCESRRDLFWDIREEMSGSGLESGEF